MNLSEVAWQNALAKGVCAVTCFGLLLTALAAIIISARRAGPDANEPMLEDMAVPIVLLVAVVLLLFMAGVLKEREALKEKLPKCTLFRSSLVLVLGALVAPPMHLGFGILMLLAVLGFVVSLAGPKIGPRLCGVAVCDAALCLALAEVSRRGGAAGDLLQARLMLFLYGTIGAVLLPCFSMLSTVAYLPKVSWASVAGYTVLGLHAAVVFLQGLAELMRTSISGGEVDYGGGACIRSSVQSPLGVLLSSLRSSSRIPRYDGPAPPPGPCPTLDEVNALAAPDPTKVIACDSMDYGPLVFFILLGVFLVCILIVALAVFKPSKQVVPQDAVEVRSKTKWKRLCFTLFAVVGAGLVALTGTLCLTCPAEAVAVAAPAAAASIADASGGNVTNSTGNVTPSAINASTTPIPGGRLLQAASTSGTSTTRIENETSTSMTRTTSTRTFTTMTSTSTSTTSTTSATTVYVPPIICPRIEASVLVAAAPEGSCGCDSFGARGIGGIVSVTAEQMALTWCEIGSMAPLLLGLVGLGVHGFASSVAISQYNVHNAEAARIAFFRGAAARDHDNEADAADKKKEGSSIIGWQQAPADPFPEPLVELGLCRVFSV